MHTLASVRMLTALQAAPASAHSPDADFSWPVALSKLISWSGSDASQGTANRHVYLLR
eukprot:COSAG06_NODE_4713_length_4003_cov_5.387031_6_plen_58_part_00